MVNQTLEAALRYAEKGYSVIPINPSAEEETGKKPLIKWAEFQTRKANDVEIKGWWTKWPKAMVGIVTGKISNLLVMDADTQEAIDKADELIPDSVVVPAVITPRGGRHYHFAYSNGIRNSNDGLLHVRGEGGYAICPPSINQQGKGYSWINEESELPELPSAVKEYLKDIAFSLYRSATEEREQSVTNVTKRNIIYTQGNRDDSLFHAAYCLIKGGASKETVSQTIEILAKGCTPPFPESEIPEKIRSAISHSDRKGTNLMEELRQWVSETNGNFSITEAIQDITNRNKEDRGKIRVYLSRMVESGDIERVLGKNGWFRKREKDLQEIEWENCDDTIVNVKWPFNLEQFYLCLPKNIVIIAGSPDAGKTAFCLNFAMLNMHLYPIKYFSSEMGALELKTRLKKFQGNIKNWKRVKFIERNSNFADVIEPDGINIVDYIEVPEDAWKIATPINEIFRKLDKGICVIALQKPRGRDVARGGESTLDRPRLYLSMGNGEIKIVKCKNWDQDDRNPNNLIMKYKIVQGCNFIQETDWGIPFDNMGR